MGCVKYILICILFATQLLVGIPDFLRGGEDYWLRAATYPFFHASWPHFIINSIAIWGLYGRSCKPCRDLLFPYFISLLVYPLSFRPVIGFSNILYAVIGMRTPPLSSPWWKSRNVIIFLAVTLLMAALPQFAATTHIAAFLLGIAGAYTSRYIQSLNKDARRYY